MPPGFAPIRLASRPALAAVAILVAGLPATAAARPLPPAWTFPTGAAQQPADGAAQQPAGEAAVTPEDTAEAPAPVQPQAPPPAGYATLDDVDRAMRQLGARELARTPGDRPLWVASFGVDQTPGKPAILIVANLAGDRLVGTEIALRLAEHFAIDSPLLEAASVHVVPVANPDGMAAVLDGRPPHRGAPVDEDHDGRTDEDGPDDLNDDGHLTQLRYPGPTGRWLADEDDPRVLREADRAAGERGTWIVEAEGRDEDGDEAQAEDGPGGVALNANFPHRHREHAPDSGVFQLSEPEARALADFVLGNERLALILVLDAEDNLAQPPGGIDRARQDSTDPLKEDAALLKLWHDRLYGDTDHLPRGADHGHGNFADWAYFQAGVPVIESCLWSPPLDVADADGETGGSDEVKMLRWADAHLTAAFVPWTAIDGGRADVAGGAETIEVGGWLPLVRTNPPAGSLDTLAADWIGFVDGLAGDFARIEAHPRVEDRGNGVLAVEVDVVNTGLLATVCDMGRVTRRHLPLRAVLDLPSGGQVLSGSETQALPRLEGLGGSATLRWLLHVPAGETARLHLISRTAGERVVPLSTD